MQDLAIELDGKKLSEVNQFHTEFARVFGFPEFYGRNMDAWIDCMSYLDDPEGNISSTTVKPGSTITLMIANHLHFKEHAPQLWAALHDCTEIVNERFNDAGTHTKIALAFNDQGETT